MYSISSFNAYFPSSLFGVLIVTFFASNIFTDSTSVVTILVSVTVSGSFPASSTVLPSATTVFIIILSAFPCISFWWVTVYVAIITAVSSFTSVVSSVASFKAFKSPIINFPSLSNVNCFSSPFITRFVISTPSSWSFNVTFVKSLLPVFVTVIVYSITSPAWTLVSIPMLSSFLLISETIFSTSILAVSTLSSLVGVPPTFAMFLIPPSTLTTSTVNSFNIVSLATNDIDHATESAVSEINAPSATTNFVPSGTWSVIYVVPFESPVFSTIILYVIKSPTLAVSTSSYCCVFSFNLDIILDFFVLIIDVFVGSPSLLSSPFAIAVFKIVPVDGISFPSLSNIVSFTFTVNRAIIVFPAGIVTTHFTPSTLFLVPTVVFVPTILLDNSSSTSLDIIASSIDTNVVFCGILSVISISSTASSPLLVTDITYVISWPTYTNWSPPTPVITDFFTVICGSFTPSFVGVTPTSIGFHQSQKSFDTNLSCSSTLVITVSPTSFTSVFVVTPVLFETLSLFVTWLSVFSFSTSLFCVSPTFTLSGIVIFSSPESGFVVESSKFAFSACSLFSLSWTPPSVWVPLSTWFSSTIWLPSATCSSFATWFPSIASVLPLSYKNIPTDRPAINNSTTTAIIAIIFFLFIFIPPKIIFLLLLILIFACFHSYT